MKKAVQQGIAIPCRSISPCCKGRKLLMYHEKRRCKSAINPPKIPKQKCPQSDFSFTALSSPLISKSLFFKDQAFSALLMSRLRWSTICSATTTSSPLKEIWIILLDTKLLYKLIEQDQLLPAVISGFSILFLGEYRFFLKKVSSTFKNSEIRLGFHFSVCGFPPIHSLHLLSKAKLTCKKPFHT